jgi:hypothetical protein
MQVSAVIRLSWRWLQGLGPRQTTDPDALSNRNVDDGIPVRDPVASPGMILDSPLPLQSIGSIDGIIVSSVRYPKSHLILPYLAAEDLPTRHMTGRITQRRAYE